MDEQGIDLRDYLRVLKKRWKLIVWITGGCAVISVVFSLLQSKVYEATALVEPAKIQKVPIETAASLELLFKNPLNPYLKEIAREMNMAEKQAYKLAGSFRVLDKVGYLQVSGIGKTPEASKKLVDLICSLILKKHSELMEDVLKISNNEVNNLKEQLISVKSEIEQLSKKLLQKEKTDIVAQSYVFQSLGTSKENALKRQLELEERLRAKDMELKYYTKQAVVIAEATTPKYRIAPHRRKIVSKAIIISFAFSIFFVFIVDYFKKNPL